MPNPFAPYKQANHDEALRKHKASVPHKAQTIVDRPDPFLNYQRPKAAEQRAGGMTSGPAGKSTHARKDVKLGEARTEIGPLTVQVIQAPRAQQRLDKSGKSASSGAPARLGPRTEGGDALRPKC